MDISISMSELSRRLRAVSSAFSASQAALITSKKNIFYLCGLQGLEGELFITRDKCYLLTDSRYSEASSKVSRLFELIVTGNTLKEEKKLIIKHGIKSVLIEPQAVSVSRYSLMSKKLGCQVASSDKLEKLMRQKRIVKTPEELRLLRTAHKIAEDALSEILQRLHVGVSEKELSLELEYLMRKKGAECISFDLITIAGQNTSLPHGVPGDYRVNDGDFVTFDIGAVYGGYHSDMTRTVAVGKVSDEQRLIYDIVLNAQLSAIKELKPGVAASDIDLAARQVIESGGYGKCFGHATGHGVGLDIHEPPTASKKSKDILLPGMTVTVEPGIYLPGKFGVRIEDTVVITESGYENLVNLPKELLIL